jgi:membrane protease YdiL (CAAX protease family)
MNGENMTDRFYGEVKRGVTGKTFCGRKLKTDCLFFLVRLFIISEQTTGFLEFHCSKQKNSKYTWAAFRVMYSLLLVFANGKGNDINYVTLDKVFLTSFTLFLWKI